MTVKARRFAPKSRPAGALLTRLDAAPSVTSAALAGDLRALLRWTLRTACRARRGKPRPPTFLGLRRCAPGRGAIGWTPTPKRGGSGLRSALWADLATTRRGYAPRCATGPWAALNRLGPILVCGSPQSAFRRPAGAGAPTGARPGGLAPASRFSRARKFAGRPPLGRGHGVTGLVCSLVIARKGGGERPKLFGLLPEEDFLGKGVALYQINMRYW